ncbi:Ethanolamine ammonia-lyase light chain [Psychromonas ingrahamii 37]|uniref:Ethanolamine ammonia-lyase small subunit n=1 Tax=Psychromonas ingrahamii (strain DSM 17664 / CCUG 51855 / 37) TaxID=357804 RepID=A1SRM8_PSYIN|nr:ethanolamine ammonia-lyase subunit EutC [Psychromonas ingrahamii]ABM02143.1 Ethanolamine ammonia-lyase light chain [Psychromonas ingrahamii 37]
MNKVVPSSEEMVHKDPWEKLRQFTNARIGLGRVGTSIPTAELLRFQLSHAQAIDAVHVPLDVEQLDQQFAASDVLQPYLPIQKLHSKVRDRMEYLQRPDLGRQLDDASIYKLQQKNTGESYDVVFVVADGLSSYAISNHAKPFLDILINSLNQDPNKEWKIAPLCLVLQGRVAVGDDVCEALNAKAVVLLIGERPGLSSPDSMGLYLTWNAKRGIEDSQRNCVSNIRPEGLQYQAAAHKCRYLLNESQRMKLSGVSLKDRSEDLQLESTTTQQFCLTI